MKRSQLCITTVLAAVVVAGLAAEDARAQATSYYPPSPRVQYAWRPASSPDIVLKPAVQPAAYRVANRVSNTAAVLPPPVATPVVAYQPVPYQPVQYQSTQPPALSQPPVLALPPVLAPPPAPAGCCGNTGCLGQAFTPTTFASPYSQSPYAQATYAPATPTVKAYRPLVNLVKPPPTYTVGQGLWGQSKVYIPNQHVRNTLRYLTP